MSYAGTFEPPVSPGAVGPQTLDFSDALKTFDAVNRIVSTQMIVSPKSKVADPNVGGLINGAPSLIGNMVAQVCGQAAPSGYVAGALYILIATVVSNQGEVLVGWGHIQCKGFV